MSKLSKFLRSPGEFWRDFLIKRYPGDMDGVGQEHRRATRGPANGSAPVQPLEAYPVTFPIDVVYTWVDGDDPAWLAKKSAAQETTVQATEAATTAARFSCRGELMYSLRSIEYYAPWVNHIYIVTDRQVPQWLDTDNDKVTVVDHAEIIPPQYLPTFNSHVIEAHLHRIPGLAEHYVYFNDDVMLARPITPAHFFAANGNAHLFLTRSQTPVGSITIYDTPTQVAAKNARELLSQRFDQYMLYNFAHTFHPQLKSVNAHMADEFASAIAGFCTNRFRGRTDVAVATYLAPNYTYLSRRGDLRTTRWVYFSVRSPFAVRHYRALLRWKGTAHAPHSMCLNDITVMGASDEALLRRETEFLQRYFPVRSSFEKPAEMPADVIRAGEADSAIVTPVESADEPQTARSSDPAIPVPTSPDERPVNRESSTLLVGGAGLRKTG